MPTLLIADDHPLFRAALHRAADEAVVDLQISEADSLDGVLEALENQQIDLMLLDLHMPGNHGLAGLATIRALQPGLAIIIVSANEEPQVIRRAIDLGAAGYLPKSSGLVDLQQALQTVLDGERWIPAMLRETVARVAPFSKDADLAARLSSLSAHQYKVLSLVAEGLLNKQIADRLGVQLRTVKAHMTRIMGRLGVRNRAQAIRVLHELGLTDASRQIDDVQELRLREQPEDA
ncbi:response regulator transcription factor [Stenotrophomonas sp. SY1]|uniref:response regulator transcription factor n=1 Tax=Stenotrophomonas sp. SY1 TaxID=477235 RepID=UPI001E2B1F2B|nr:response regulator transcription factor [Stenotrophomonas sp. SY1]MCD9087742.1 response regulator transcription factor [Stenotrophomonas sp. SY1]